MQRNWVYGSQKLSETISGLQLPDAVLLSFMKKSKSAEYFLVRMTELSGHVVVGLWLSDWASWLSDCMEFLGSKCYFKHCVSIAVIKVDSLWNSGCLDAAEAQLHSTQPSCLSCATLHWSWTPESQPRARHWWDSCANSCTPTHLPTPATSCVM